eukprot:COSAG01_NODE_33629_length_561_cov_0.958874_1_plen_187_part_11
MLRTVLTTSQSTKVDLLQEIRPLVQAAAQLYYCKGTAADQVLRVSTEDFEKEWEKAGTMAELMERPAQILRAVDMLIVALAQDLSRCSDERSLALRVEYASTLVRARAVCWLACIELASYGPIVAWLRGWAKRMFDGPALSMGVRLATSVVDDIVAAAEGRQLLAEELGKVLNPYTAAAAAAAADAT